MDTIDELPQGVSWVYNEVELTGDVLDDEGNPRKEKLELWYRDPVEVVRELMGNPVFKDVMRYAPEHYYSDVSEGEGTHRIINEMWSADWWWEVQVSLGGVGNDPRQC